MPRLSFKPDASFFRKIAIGAVGARAVAKDLSRHGHKMVELERGSTDTKLWKDVKRKRVRIPDLVCFAVRTENREPCENQGRFVDVPQPNGRGAGMGFWHG